MIIKKTKVIINKLYSKGKETFLTNNKAFDNSVKENVKRIYIVSILAAVMHLTISIIFAANIYNNNFENINWEIAIFKTHLVLAVLSIIVFMWSEHAKRHLNNKKITHLLQYTYFAMLVSAGIYIFAVDQSITTSMTPFFIASLSVGAFFLIRPLHAFILYLFTYVAYMIVLSMASLPTSAELSHNVNGLAMVFIGFTISFIEWNKFIVNEKQIQEIANQKDKLEKMAYYDPLTEIPNRRLFDISLQKEILKDKISNDTSVVIILDLDYFKDINDTYGHPVGDFVLRQIAKLLSDNIRKVDTIARFGGEEFIILIPNTTIDNGFIIADKLRKLIMEKDFHIDNKNIKLTASFGVAELEDNQNNNFYYKADKALYVAKQSGRNQVQKYEDEI